MKANELRVGNWVSIKGEPVQVESIFKHEINIEPYSWGDSGDVSINGFDEFEPIPLTIELMRAAGFEVDGDVWYMPDGGEWIRDTVDGPASDPAGLGRVAAERMLQAGAGALLAAASASV